MPSPDLSLQTIVFTTLDAALTETVLAHPRHAEAFPYVFLGQSEVSDDHPTGHRMRLEVHVWSRKEGPHEAKTIQHTIRDEIHASTLVHGGWNFTCVREEFADCRLDPDGETWHGVQRFVCNASLA